MRSTFRRIAIVGAVVAASGLVGGTAFGLPVATDSDVNDDAVGRPNAYVQRVQREAARALRTASDAQDRYLGLGGVSPGPLPGPTPGFHPEDYVNAAIQTVSQAGADVGRGLGGVYVPPIPSPTPGIEPDPNGRNTRLVNSAVRTVGKTIEDAALGLGGVVVGPLPAPTPGIRPQDIRVRVP